MNHEEFKILAAGLRLAIEKLDEADRRIMSAQNEKERCMRTYVEQWKKFKPAAEALGFAVSEQDWKNLLPVIAPPVTAARGVATGVVHHDN